MAISDSGSDQGARLLQRAAAGTLERIERDRKRADNVGVERILACLGRNLFRRGLNVKWLRAVLGLHDNGVSSEFRSEMGTNLRTYLEDRRLETACWLLVKTDLQVGEIGKRVGYRTLSTFSHAFERRLGCRPTVYRDTGGTAGRTDWRARETSAAPRRGPRLPRFLAGVLAVSEGQRCHRCRTPLNVGRGPRVLENLRPICDLCVRDHGPPALRSFLKRGIVEEDAKARDSPGAVVVEKAERGRRGQLSQHEADSLIWSLLSLYPQSLHVVTEYLADKSRKHEQSEGRPLLEEETSDQGLGSMDTVLRFGYWLSASRKERARAIEIWHQIRYLSIAEQQQKLRDPDPPFQTDALVVLLHGESRERVGNAPQRAREIAELAVTAAETLARDLTGPLRANDLEADTWAWLANTQRIAYDLNGANAALANAYDRYHQGTRTTIRWARILDYEGSLRRDQRRFDEALVCLDRAVEIYRNADEPELAGKVLINKATVYQQSGQPDRGIPLLRQALPLFDPELHPQMLLQTQYNLVSCLCDCGRYHDSLVILPNLRELCRITTERTDEPRVNWLEGRIEAGIGNSTKAERILRCVKGKFLDIGLVYDAALVSLDLAAIYAHHGHADEMARLAEALVPIFQSQEIHREAVAALEILRRALKGNEVSQELVNRLRNYLKQARFDPDLKFK